MSKYLYGASVQGIQEFIFKTNKLQEIVGASEIVKNVAKLFEDISGYKKGDNHILINAAGNIKAIFDKKEECEKFGLSYSYVNAWGSTTKTKEIKYPSWVFHYLKDVMYYKMEAIKIKMALEKIYARLNSGETLTDIYREITVDSKIYLDETDPSISIPEEMILKDSEYFFNL